MALVRNNDARLLRVVAKTGSSRVSFVLRPGDNEIPDCDLSFVQEHSPVFGLWLQPGTAQDRNGKSEKPRVEIVAKAKAPAKKRSKKKAASKKKKEEAPLPPPDQAEEYE